MDNDIVIKVDGISKRYEIGELESYPTLRDKIMGLPSAILGKKKKKKTFWALKNVSFEIKRGEVVGIIGRNGAGKSTMLKILARITEPTSGTITMKGRVASMLEVGTGFNQELTGRENVYLNGSILGMSRKEISAKFDEILEFSGIGEFIDTPVKHYSSGMYVRLAFAVAAFLDSDILLVDEVLAVGDAEFQKKCLGKIDNLSKSGKTVIFISHNIETIIKLCSKVVYLSGGKVVLFDDTHSAVSKYLSSSNQEKGNYNGPLSDSIYIEKIKINGRVQQVTTISPQEEIQILIFGQSKREFKKISITLAIYSESTRLCSIQDSHKPSLLAKGKFISKFVLPPHLFRPGKYQIYAGGYQESSDNWFYGSMLCSFEILPVWSEVYKNTNIGIINLNLTGQRKQ